MSEYKLVYDLKKHLARCPEMVADTHAATLDKSKPGGLKGEHGLYGSDEWWHNIENGLIETEVFEGTIYKVLIDMEYDLLDNYDNAVGVKLDDSYIDIDLGSDGLSCFGARFTDSESVESFKSLYRIGNRIKATFILDKLKDPENWLGPRRKKGVLYLPWQVFLKESEL